jgi:hypothetical protein
MGEEGRAGWFVTPAEGRRKEMLMAFSLRKGEKAKASTGLWGAVRASPVPQAASRPPPQGRLQKKTHTLTVVATYPRPRAPHHLAEEPQGWWHAKSGHLRMLEP